MIKTENSSPYKKRICFDFDGVIHSYTSGWKGADIIPDPPVKGAKEVIDELISKHYEIVIFSTRARIVQGYNAIQEYLNKHNIEFDMITSDKIPAFVYIDDRAICFNGDMSGLIEQIDTFVPWLKKAQVEA